MHSPKGLARARESSIVDVNKYPDWTNAGRAGPWSRHSTIERMGSGSNPVRCSFFFFFQVQPYNRKYRSIGRRVW